jgi:hypothetical protein
MIELTLKRPTQSDTTRATAASGKAGARNSPDKPRAAVPFSFVHFFWAMQKKWTIGFKRCEAPFGYCMTHAKSEFF